MKTTTFAFKAKTAFVKSKVIIGAVVLGLAVSFEVATLSSPAQASASFSKKHKASCAKCHSTQGMTDGSMFPLTRAGTYFQTNRRLPGASKPVRPATPPPYVPPPVTPQYNPPGTPPPRGGGNNQQGGGYNPPPPTGGGYNPPPPTGGGYNPPPPRGGGYNQQGGGYNPPPPTGGGYNPPPPRGGGYNQAPRRPVSRHVAWCQRKYRSYKVRTDQYRGFDSRDHYCISPYGGNRSAPPPARRPKYDPAPRRPRYDPPTRPGRMSCSQAKRVLRSQGYRRIRVDDCSGGRYTFFARRGGDLWRLRLRASTGVIYKRTRK